MGANISAAKPPRRRSLPPLRPLWLWGGIGLLYNAGTLFGLTDAIGIGASAYLTATSMIWIGGMVLFGMGALLSHNDFDGERPLQAGVDDVRITR